MSYHDTVCREQHHTCTECGACLHLCKCHETAIPMGEEKPCDSYCGQQATRRIVADGYSLSLCDACWKENERHGHQTMLAIREQRDRYADLIENAISFIRGREAICIRVTRSVCECSACWIEDEYDRVRSAPREGETK